MGIKLNCDLGESFGAWSMGMDEAIVPYIDMANFACGFHAGDPKTMDKSIALAKKHGVLIGAHVAYPDLVGFGRRSMECSDAEIEALVIYQCGALQAFCQSHGVELFYVKPHGALYNDMMKDERIFGAILSAIGRYNKRLKVMILSMKDTSAQERIASEYGIELLYEVFADRAYSDEGFLVPRTQKGAVLHDVERVKSRLLLLQKEGTVETISGKKIVLKADSLCVHSDTKEAVEMVMMLKACL